jgi:hypothetical protein
MEKNSTDRKEKTTKENLNTCSRKYVPKKEIGILRPYEDGSTGNRVIQPKRELFKFFLKVQRYMHLRYSNEHTI